MAKYEVTVSAIITFIQETEATFIVEADDEKAALMEARAQASSEIERSSFEAEYDDTEYHVESVICLEPEKEEPKRCNKTIDLLEILESAES